MKILLFTADWCKPCLLIKQYIFNYRSYGDIYRSYGDIEIVDVEEQPQMASRYLIRNLPTVIFEKDGKVLDVIVGALPEQKFREKIKNIKEAKNARKNH